MSSPVEITVQHGDILTAECDVIALKYAQNFYGADAAVAGRLRASGIEPNTLCPADGSHVLVRSNGAVEAKEVLFVGLPAAALFSYQDIRRLGANVLRILKNERPRTASLAMTIHGRGFGLDEIECVQQQLLGYKDSFTYGAFPEHLTKIVIFERDPDRVEAIEQAISEAFAQDADARSSTGPATRKREGTQSYPLPAWSSTVASARIVPKLKIFVAMPFAREMRDIWTFGIQQPVRKLGLLCERLDEESFIGDMLTQVTRRIENASLVIADLTGSNPNVFLEVGYAWGKGRPTILLFRKTKKGRHEEKLPFDVSGQRCIVYEDATDLREQLAIELVKLGFAEASVADER